MNDLPDILDLQDDFPRSWGHALDNPKIVRLTSAFIAIVLPLSILGMMLLPWQQVSIGRGKVIAYSPENRRQVVEASVEGRIAKWLVQEGQSVKKGAPLVELLDIDPNIISRLERQYEALEVNLQASEKALEISKKNLNRQRELAKKGLSSQRAFEKSQLEVANYETEVSAAKAKLADLEVKVSRQKSQAITADQAGVVMRILKPQGGELVKAGDPLALLVPDTEDRAVEILISGNDLPLIQPGRHVRLQFEGWPAVQFTGWPSVAVGTFGGIVKYVDLADDGNGNYRVLVFPDPGDNPWPRGNYLRQGVKAIGWILLDEVSLGWELWRRLNGFPVTVSNTTTEK